MQDKEALQSFMEISQEIGKNPAYVQGGGGNTSVKLDDFRMAIKASGEMLQNVTETDGYCIVDYVSIQRFMENPSQEDDEFSRQINSFAFPSNNKPSIETAFHTLLKKFVIHTHSVYANVLTCSKEGKSIAKGLFPESLWVRYATPGRDLTLLIQNELKGLKNLPEIIFLENHGIIISSDDPHYAFELHESINKKIYDYFQIPENSFNNEKGLECAQEMKKNILFPDQVVYTLGGNKILKTKAAKETIQAYNFILKTIKEKGLEPSFISQEKASILLEMESEKYRQKKVNL